MSVKSQFIICRRAACCVRLFTNTIGGGGGPQLFFMLLCVDFLRLATSIEFLTGSQDGMDRQDDARQLFLAAATRFGGSLH